MIKKWDLFTESRDLEIQSNLEILKDAMTELSDKYEVSYNFQSLGKDPHVVYMLGVNVELKYYFPRACDFLVVSKILDIKKPGTESAHNELIDISTLLKEGLDRSQLIWKSMNFSINNKGGTHTQDSLQVWITMSHSN